VLARLGWTQFFQRHFHQDLKSISTNIAEIHHPAAPYLARLARYGVPAWCSDPPWSLVQQDAAIAHGPHPSASRQFSEFLLEDMFDYAKMGYWLVLPYSAIRGHPSLKIAPVGVVLQRERRPRPIMDYSCNGVNQASIPLAPLSAMQFGTALQRILQRIAYCNPSFGAPLIAKIDLSDGYYRVTLSPEAALQLAVCLPPDNRGEALLGIPLSLPLGWSLSPPYFCAFTETCRILPTVTNLAILNTLISMSQSGSNEMTYMRPSVRLLSSLTTPTNQNTLCHILMYTLMILCSWLKRPTTCRSWKPYCTICTLFSETLLAHRVGLSSQNPKSTKGMPPSKHGKLSWVGISIPKQ